jgi:hypothetical protein
MLNGLSSDLGAINAVAYRQRNGTLANLSFVPPACSGGRASLISPTATTLVPKSVVQKLLILVEYGPKDANSNGMLARAIR